MHYLFYLGIFLQFLVNDLIIKYNGYYNACCGAACDMYCNRLMETYYNCYVCNDNVSLTNNL